MKELKAPEKIYIFKDELQHEDHVVMYGVNQDKGIEGLVEYTCTDAFVEKAVNFLNSRLSGIVAIKDGNITQGLLRTRSEFIEEFKKYIQGE